MSVNGAAATENTGETEEHTKSLLSKDHLTILFERGITEQMGIAAGLRSTSSRAAKDILGFDPQSGGILIPYTHPHTKAIRTFRFRPDKPLVINEKQAKYLTPRGVSNLIYFPPGIGERLEDCADPLVITEGEFKALSAVQHGFLCIGLTGVWGWKTRADGQSQPIPDLDLINVRSRGVTIVFDSDVSLNSQVKRARHALGKGAL